MSSDNDETNNAFKEDGNNTKEKRCRWVAMTRLMIEHGNVVTTHPFLNDGNIKDLYFIRQLIQDLPYRASHGILKAAWDTMADKLDALVDSQNQKIYGGLMKGRTAQNRFNQYLDFAKKLEKSESSALESESGDDDASEIKLGLKFLYDDWKSHQGSQEKQRKDVAMKSKVEKKAAQMIRQATRSGATTGVFQPASTDDEQSEASSQADGSFCTPAAAATESPRNNVARASAKSGRSAWIHDQVATMTKTLRKRQARERSSSPPPAKDDDRKRRASYDLESRRLRLEEERLKFEIKKFEKEYDEREQERKAQAEARALELKLQAAERNEERKARAEERLATLKLFESITKLLDRRGN